MRANDTGDFSSVIYVRGPRKTTITVTDHRENDSTSVWELPGGKMKLGETPARTATRELFEETGLRVHANRLRPVAQIQKRKRKKRWTLYLFVVDVDSYDGLAKYGTEGERVGILFQKTLNNRIDFRTEHKRILNLAGLL